MASGLSRGLTRTTALLPMTSEPRDGTVVKVQHGPGQEVVLAHWSGQGQAWIRDDDPLRRSLHRVTGWRPVTG